MAGETILNKAARIRRQADRLYECINSGQRFTATVICCLMKKTLDDIETDIIKDNKNKPGINLKISKN